MTSGTYPDRVAVVTERVAARSMASGSPQRLDASVAELAHPLEERFDRRQLVRDVVHRGPLGPGERDAVVVGVTSEEHHLIFRPVADPEAHDVGPEVDRSVHVDRIEHNVRQRKRASLTGVARRDRSHLRAQHDEATLGVAEANLVAAARAVALTGIELEPNAVSHQPLGSRLDVSGDRYGERKVSKAGHVGTDEIEDVVLGSGAAQTETTIARRRPTPAPTRRCRTSEHRRATCS